MILFAIFCGNKKRSHYGLAGVANGHVRDRKPRRFAIAIFGALSFQLSDAGGRQKPLGHSFSYFRSSS